MIRQATVDDLGILLEYGEYFWTLTPYVSTGMEYDTDSVAMLLVSLMDDHYLRVVEEEGVVVGFIGIMISPFHFNTNYQIASELFFFIDPDYRGQGAALLEQAEADLKAKGADVIAMGELMSSTDMKKFYESKGYTLTEQTYAKVL